MSSSLVDCGTLTTPVQGTVSLTATTVGSVAVYACNLGFTLSGDATRICQATGMWSGQQPTCSSKSVPYAWLPLPILPISLERLRWNAICFLNYMDSKKKEGNWEDHVWLVCNPLCILCARLIAIHLHAGDAFFPKWHVHEF